MTPDEHTAAINALQHDVSEIKSILNNGLRTMVHDQRSELVTVKADIQLIRDALTGHVAKEDVIYEIFKRVMNTGVAITGALIALLLSIIGYLLVNPVSLGYRAGALREAATGPTATSRDECGFSRSVLS